MTEGTDRCAQRRLRDVPIRTAVPDDEPALRRLQGLLPEPGPQLLSYGLSAGTVLVTTSHGSTGSLTGTPESRTNERPVGYLLAIHGPDTHLAELVVAPDFRRSGRASALLAALLAQRPDDERVTLAVARGNEAAQSLYREFGFEQVGTSDALFEGGTALILERSVQDE